MKPSDLFANKIMVAVYDKDFTVRGGFKRQPISRTGDKISIHRGGKANFNPSFDSESVLKIKYPKWKFWKRSFDLAVVDNQGDACLNFKTKIATGPNPETVKKAAETGLLENLGREKAELNMLSYISLAMNALILLKLFGVLK